MKKLAIVCCAGMLSMLFACQSTASEKAATTTSSSSTAVIDSSKNDNTLPFPVYDNYSALEHIFQYQNDTTYIINFWATWCKPCVEELPYFEKLIPMLEGKKARVILVSLDFKRDVNTKLLSFVKKRGLEAQVIALTDGRYGEWVGKVDPDWGGSIPATVIYNPKARKFIEQQFSSYEELESLVNAFL